MQFFPYLSLHSFCTERTALRVLADHIQLFSPR